MILSYIVIFTILIILLLVGLYLLNRENKIKNTSSQLIQGTVVKYSVQNTRAPVVEYKVEVTTYRKALNYSYVSSTRTPTAKIKAVTKDDILDTKLRLRSNSMISINTIMSDTFPIGSSLNVYYNPENPKIAYVERFAPMYTGRIFLASSVVLLIAFSILIAITL